MTGKTETAQKEFVISRTLNAPRDLVWKAWTQAEHMKQWFTPKGYTGRIAKMDFRPGGRYLYCLQDPEGKDMWGKMDYREIQEPERIVYINSFSDAEGNSTRHPLSPDWPLEMLSTVTFEEQGDKTLITIHWLPFNATEAEEKIFEEGRPSMTEGWTGTLDQLEEYLSNQSL